MYEGFMYNPALAAKIETDLIQSKGCLFLDGTCSVHVVKLVSLKCFCRAGVTTHCWPTGVLFHPMFFQNHERLIELGPVMQPIVYANHPSALDFQTVSSNLSLVDIILFYKR